MNFLFGFDLNLLYLKSNGTYLCCFSFHYPQTIWIALKLTFCKFRPYHCQNVIIAKCFIEGIVIRISSNVNLIQNKKKIAKKYIKGLSIKHVQNIPRKTNISNPLIRTRMRIRGLEIVVFLKCFAFALNGESLNEVDLNTKPWDKPK